MITAFKQLLLLISDRGLKLGAGIIINILVARNLDNSQYASIAIGLAITSVVFPVVTFGLQGIIYDTALKYKTIVILDRFLDKVIKKAFLISSIVYSVLLLLIQQFFSYNLYELLIITNIFLYSLFRIVDLYRGMFEANHKADILVKFEWIAYGIIVILRLYILHVLPNVIYYSLTYVLDSILLAISIYYAKKKLIDLLDNREENGFDSFISIKQFSSKAFQLGIYTVLIACMREGDKFLIERVFGSEFLGVYAKMFITITPLFFIPVVIGSAMMPLLQGTKESTFFKYRRTILSLTILQGLGIASLIVFFRFEICSLLKLTDHSDLLIGLAWIYPLVSMVSILNRFNVYDEELVISWSSACVGLCGFMLVMLFFPLTKSSAFYPQLFGWALVGIILLINEIVKNVKHLGNSV